jgi:hypothetical protein
MVDAEKKQFWALLNLTMELCNRPPLSKEAVISYWQILNVFDMELVKQALDEWVDNNSKSPTPNDLKEICKAKQKSKVGFSHALPKPKSDEVSQAGVDKINKLVSEKMTPKADHKAWAKRILANPDVCADIAVKMAKEAVRAV